MSMQIEILLDGEKLSHNFSQDILKEVRALSVYNQIEKLRRSAKNQESQDLLRQIKTVLAAQISLKYHAQSFKEKMEYDRIVASITRLVAQLCDDGKYNSEHRMYAYYALRKRCNEMLKSYVEHSKNEKAEMDETVDHHDYTIKYLAEGSKNPRNIELDRCEDSTVVEVDLDEAQWKRSSFSKVTFGIKKFIKDNFDIPTFAISLKDISTKDTSQAEKNRLFEELLYSMSGAFSKVKGIIFQPMSNEKASCDLDSEFQADENCHSLPKVKTLKAKSSKTKAVKAQSVDKIKPAKKRKSSKKAA